MNRSEILQIAKPILFNTDMVLAILDGRKTVTRRAVKFPVNKYTGKVPDADNVSVYSNTMRSEKVNFSEKPFYCFDVKPPYKSSDILYVRETWQYAYDLDGNDQIIEETGRYVYVADNPCPFNDWPMPDGTHRDCMPWRPSIHMPKEAARIFLRVTDVRAERLQDIMKDPPGPKNQIVREGCKYGCDFIAEWENTISKANRSQYGWDANPWVWVIEFERVEPDV